MIEYKRILFTKRGLLYMKILVINGSPKGEKSTIACVTHAFLEGMQSFDKIMPGFAAAGMKHRASAFLKMICRNCSIR